MISSEDALYEEFRTASTRQSWWMLIAISLILVGTCLWVHHLVPERPATWDYGALETIPGKSVYSTATVAPIQVGPAETSKVQQQLLKPPGAQPLEKLKPQGFEMGEE